MATEQDWINKGILLEKELDIRDRKYHFKKYKQCFVGSAAIYTIINVKLATNKEEAIEVGNQLLDRNIIRHVDGAHKFKNEDKFYEFVAGYRHKRKTSKILINGPSLFNICKEISGVNIDIKADTLPNPMRKSRSNSHRASVHTTPVIPEVLEIKHEYSNSLDDTIPHPKPRKRLSKLSGSEQNALHLFDLILKGSLFYYPWNKHIINERNQKTLTKYINNHLKGIREFNDFNLNYFQQLFDDKINKYKSEKNVFINIGQISALNADLICYFFDVNQNDFKGKLFTENGFDLGQNIQFIEMPEIIGLNESQMDLMKDSHYFGDVMFKSFQITNNAGNEFKFQIKIRRKQTSDTFCVFLYLKSNHESYKSVNIVWDFVCEELKFERVSKFAELERNKCDEIEGFAYSSLETVGSELTFAVNIRVVN